jgi:hypothetical protein
MITADGYVTINPAVASGKFNVVVMRASDGQEYVVFRISQPLNREAAEALAKSWAAATGLEMR